MRETIRFATQRNQELVDITREVQAVVAHSGIHDDLVHVYAQGATAAILIQENWDDSVQQDVIDFLSKQIPALIIVSATRRRLSCGPDQDTCKF